MGQDSMPLTHDQCQLPETHRWPAVPPTRAQAFCCVAWAQAPEGFGQITLTNDVPNTQPEHHVEEPE